MATNPYFFSNYYGSEEQSLYNDLIVEAIQIYGHDVFYVPRDYVALDKLYGEDMQSAFNRSYPIEMYVESVMGYQGQGDILQKWGLEIRDEMNLVVARSQFKTLVIDAGETALTRPKEGDLVYIPFPRGNLFEIMYVEDEEVFYQVGKLYTYQLKLKRFEMSGEQFNTGIQAIDNIETLVGFAETLTFDSGFGDYEIGEMVYQGAALNSATFKGRVKSWDSVNKKLTLNRVYGEVKATELVNGDDTGATWSITTVNTTTVKKNVNDLRTDNDLLSSSDSPNITPNVHNPLTDY